MASSIVHLAIINELIKLRSFRAEDRLKLGAVLADFGIRRETHLQIRLQNGNKRTYDLNRFRTEFGKKLLEDDLYLGYYLHLVQDIVYRRLVYGKYAWDPTIEGNIERLHRDYSILNGAIIEKYGLKNDIAVPKDFESEAINRLYAFNTDLLLESMGEFFNKREEGEIFFFTREMADEFILEAVKTCLKEQDALESGGELMDIVECAWS
jgi:hypothetical protein